MHLLGSDSRITDSGLWRWILKGLGVKQKRQPDRGLNPGPSKHIPDALTTELSGLTRQVSLTH
jgi:hypothetical protein